jgi:hypothetical protein
MPKLRDELFSRACQLLNELGDVTKYADIGSLQYDDRIEARKQLRRIVKTLQTEYKITSSTAIGHVSRSIQEIRK